MSKPNYKYNLHHYFSILLDDSVTWTKLEQHAFSEAGISSRTFQRDRNILIDDDEDIPTERLVVYARILKCEVSKMINYKSIVKPFKA